MSSILFQGLCLSFLQKRGKDLGEVSTGCHHRRCWLNRQFPKSIIFSLSIPIYMYSYVIPGLHKCPTIYIFIIISDEDDYLSIFHSLNRAYYNYTQYLAGILPTCSRPNYGSRLQIFANSQKQKLCLFHLSHLLSHFTIGMCGNVFQLQIRPFQLYS